MLSIYCIKADEQKNLSRGSLQSEEDSKFVPEISSGMFILMTNHEIIASHCKPRNLQSSKFTMTKDLNFELKTSSKLGQRVD